MFYIVYENSNERRISSPMKSRKDCEDFIDNAKRVDTSYHYSIVGDLSNKKIQVRVSSAIDSGFGLYYTFACFLIYLQIIIGIQ